ncbi:carbamoyltransferase C-terminal domain-containing protein [Saccharothrix deserti]|uniref:carbamoyltransferase C-terminal domain-containing protein n=1 Tax=Saccharothrix deserti TaxID=2593674 RepID=UPI00131AF6BA|nr:carbamoyltransferase C-terminal domain-containing protein [Saccharothrix deserti]
MRTWGISALSHDAALAVVEDGEILLAAHSERYSRKKNDSALHPDLLDEAMAFGAPDMIAWYERPHVKKLRHLRAGQWADAVSRADVPRRYLRFLGLPFPLPRIRYADHHHSHAAAAFATSGFPDATVIVGDAIGEFRTFTIGRFDTTGRFEVLHRRNYPHSLGLLYSAFTRRCGFRPNEDEYVIMGLAAFGEPRHEDAIYEDLVELEGPSFRLKVNPHRGIGDWLPEASDADLAASVQAVTEEVLVRATRWARANTTSRNLLVMGGLALNCVANSRIARLGLFDDIWICPNPGDAGSSIGAAAAVTGMRLNWSGPYLGTSVDGEYPVDALLDALADEGVVGVASGRAEFGPRALGNRSLLADPRPADMQDRVNAVKGREPFRPFAPVIRAEVADELFELPVPQSPYMQFTARCKAPHEYPAIVHHDGTSRVQTVTPRDHPGLHELLVRWEERTGCPILLNTSLNSRGEPLVNNREHADAFARRNGVAVL